MNSWVARGAITSRRTTRGDHLGDHRDGARVGCAETSDKIELQVGPRPQFIRINGTVVGALAGLAIYTVSVLIFHH